MKLVPISSIFDVRYGVNLELNRLQRDPNGVNFVSRSAKNNGVTGKVRVIEGIKPIEAGVLTVAGGGSVLETFVQTEKFYSGRDLYFLRPLVELTLEQKLYYCMCIRANKYRYNYGRQANRTLREIPIPAVDEIPDWVTEVFKNVAEDWSLHLGAMAHSSK
ncbi:restriction endonuclease subunit S [Burkholderia thailandensis]|uniref:restriction endonuclease subunit S n=1 Tax=Burkholderia thailandensis TaxID=57975 RepID=UPI0012E7B4CD|nr:restriction endonuclease subunit S [Burkholderia thailandensis]MUV26372.1 restriction endonuclease subunit S [Burkholderia thailandensis]